MISTTKTTLVLSCLVLTSAVLLAGCSDKSSDMTSDQLKQVAGGHVMAPAMQAEMEADIAKQQAQQAALQTQQAPHPTGPPTAPSTPGQ